MFNLKPESPPVILASQVYEQKQSAAVAGIASIQANVASTAISTIE